MQNSIAYAMRCHAKIEKVMPTFANPLHFLFCDLENMATLPPHLTLLSVHQSIQGGQKLLYCSGADIRHVGCDFIIFSTYDTTFVQQSHLQPHIGRRYSAVLQPVGTTPCWSLESVRPI